MTYTVYMQLDQCGVNTSSKELVGCMSRLDPRQPHNVSHLPRWPWVLADAGTYAVIRVMFSAGDSAFGPLFDNGSKLTSFDSCQPRVDCTTDSSSLQEGLYLAHPTQVPLVVEHRHCHSCKPHRSCLA